MMRRTRIALTFGLVIVAGCSQQSSSSFPPVMTVSRATAQSVRNAATYKTLYSFKDHPDGGFPIGELTAVNGKLYGATMFGGTKHDGAVYSISSDGSESVIYSFSGGADGATPEGGI
ncbi:MAG TPA: choice-of-anchor tandem repeat GloVer-containing protein [Candidatus Nitrosotalea sp.]|nr:choice-of-anchor tandem repeat GloVer-containing protein [Candidatus Nitrosotalea sp.]